jgi:hypothetical protein
MGMNEGRSVQFGLGVIMSSSNSTLIVTFASNINLSLSLPSHTAFFEPRNAEWAVRLEAEQTKRKACQPPSSTELKDLFFFFVLFVLRAEHAKSATTLGGPTENPT